MKILSYILILIISLPTLFIVSCDNNKSDDKTPPKVSDVSLNMNDSISFLLKERRIIIELNDTLSTNHQIDTLIIGHKIRFRGTFTDDVALSTAFFHIWGDTLNRQVQDTAYNMKRLIPTFMYGKQEAKIGKMGIVLIDSITRVMKRINSSVILPVIESDITPNDQYYFKVICADAAGNQDTINYAKHPVVIFHRKTIIEAFLKDSTAFKFTSKPEEKEEDKEKK